MKRILLSFICLSLFSSFAFAAPGAADMAKGKKLYAAKKYSQAYAAFEKAAKANPKNAQAYLFMGYCSLATKDRDGAIRNIERSLKIKPDKNLKKYLAGLKSGKSSPSGGGAGAYYYTGGQNRALAMGNPRIALRDSSAALDIYGGAQNTAGLSMRPRQNLASINLSYVSFYNMMSGVFFTLPISVEVSRGYFMAGGDPRRNMNAFTYWLTENDVLSAKLAFALPGYRSRSVTGPLIVESSQSGIGLIGAVEYSRKFMKNLSLGVTAGYRGGWMNDPPDPDTGLTISQEVSSRIDWAVSAAFDPGLSGAKLVAGLTVGDIASFDDYSSFYDWGGTYEQVPDDYINLESLDTTVVYEGTGFRTEQISKDSVFGINTALSAGFEMGALELLASLDYTAGITAAMSGSTTIIDTTTGDENVTIDPVFNNVTNGGLFGGAIKGRYGLGLVDVSLSMLFSSSGYSMYSGPSDDDATIRSIGLSRFVAGAAVKPGSFTIPVEFMYEGTGYSDLNTASGNTTKYDYSSLGVKAGCEFRLNRELAFRAGLGYISTSTTWISGGTAGPAPGEDGNPIQSGFDISAGAGYRLGKTEIDLAFSYIIDSVDPLDDMYQTYSSNQLNISLGANIPL